MGGNRRTQYVAFLQPCGMQAGHTGVSLQVMFSTSLLLYSEMRLEFIVTIFSRGCISGGYTEDNGILKLTEKGG